MNTIEGIYNFIKNAVLNAVGVERDFYKLIQDKDVSKVQQLFQNRDSEVLDAIKEYDPKKHKVMFRRNKPLKGGKMYISEKLPRRWQVYINEIELFFLLAKPLQWKVQNAQEDTEDAYNAFTEFLEDIRYDATMRQVKRFAGAETESAKWYHLYNDDGKPKVKIIVLSKSQGHSLRPLIDQYRNMVAFGYGYYLNESGKTVEHFDIQTKDWIFKCRKSGIGWDVVTISNPTGKINVIYYQQPKAWEGTDERIARDEMLDSKAGDTNNRFADPKAIMTASVINQLKNPEVMDIIQVENGAKFEYVSPPEASESKRDEKEVMTKTILQDSFTPDFSFEAMKGMGTLSGEALRRAMILGYIKRDNRREIYDELVNRDLKVIFAIMMNVTHIQLRDKLANLKIKHDFADPFDEDKYTEWSAIGKAFTDGIISLETAVKLMGIANPVEEIEKIKAEKQSALEEYVYPIGGEE